MEESFSSITENLTESMTALTDKFASAIPGIVLGILGLIVAWLIIKLVLFVLKRVLKASKIDVLSDKISNLKVFGDKAIKVDLLRAILAFTRVLLIFLFVFIIAALLKLNAVTDALIGVLKYLPVLLTAIVIFIGGMYLAVVVKKALLSIFESMGISGSKVISATAFYLIVFFTSVTALNQAGVNTELITSNFTLILGAFLFAIALGFGLGSRDVITDLLRMFYARKNYLVGDKIEVGEYVGTIEAIDNISLTLKTKEGKVIIPIKEITNTAVMIKKTD